MGEGEWSLQVASDIARDGLGVELLDVRGKVRAEVFRCDSDHTVTVSHFDGAEPAPPAVLDWYYAEAALRLESFEDGSPLPALSAWHGLPARSMIEICVGVRLRTRWLETQPSAREISALRRTFPEITEAGLAVLREQFADGQPFTSQLTTVSCARALSAQARALGLELEVVKEMASVDADDHTWISDGSDATPFASGPGVHAIGWLSPAHPYPRGSTPRALVERLNSLVIGHKWLPHCFLGVHTCGFCGSASGTQAILVPAGRVLFVAPDLVGHYVEEHDYRPCDAFIHGVAACPNPASPAYFALIRPFAGLWPHGTVPEVT